MMTRGAEPVICASTSDTGGDAFAYFCDRIADVYLGIRPQRPSDTDDGFAADVLAHRLSDDVILSRMRAPAHGARRDAHSIAASADDGLFLNVAADAIVRIDHLGERRRLRAGQPILIDNGRPFDLDLVGPRRFRLYTLRLPRRLGDRELSSREIAEINERLSGDLGRTIGMQAMLMIREFDERQLNVAAAMSAAILALLASTGAPPIEQSPADRFGALVALAEPRLRDPAFGLTDLARLAGCSPRTVQSVFTRAGRTWSEWASERRLESARARIASPEWETTALARIAHVSGFADPSHFHRAFRARYGDVPSAFRPVR